MNDKNPFLELSSYAIIGALIGLYVGSLFDASGMQLQFWSEAVVRLLAGAGDSIGEILFVSYFFFKNKKAHATISYVLGKLIGMLVAPIIHFITLQVSPNPHGISSVLYIAAYSNFDNLFGGLAYLFTKIRKEKNLKKGWQSFVSEAYQVGNMLAVFSLMSMVLITKLLGIVPLTHSFSALESGMLDTDSILATVYARLIQKNKSKDKL